MVNVRNDGKVAHPLGRHLQRQSTEGSESVPGCGGGRDGERDSVRWVSGLLHPRRHGFSACVHLGTAANADYMRPTRACASGGGSGGRRQAAPTLTTLPPAYVCAFPPCSPRVSGAATLLGRTASRRAGRLLLLAAGSGSPRKGCCRSLSGHGATVAAACLRPDVLAAQPACGAAVSRIALQRRWQCAEARAGYVRHNARCRAGGRFRWGGGGGRRQRGGGQGGPRAGRPSSLTAWVRDCLG